MSVMEDVRCPECGEVESEGGICLNVNCDRAVRQATAGAGRATHKATAAASATDSPNAFTSSGRVD
jgi:hypothetical protein